MLRAGTLQEENGRFISRADQFLQRANGHEYSRALSVLEDADHAPIVIQHCVGIADLDVFCFRLPVVDKHVVRAFHIVALEKRKSPGHRTKAFRIDAINYFHTAGGIELEQRWRSSLHVFQLGKPASDFDRHGRAAEAEEYRGCRRLNHDIRADALDAFGAFLQQAGGQPDDQHHQRDLDGNGHHTNQSSKGPVQ